MRKLNGYTFIELLVTIGLLMGVALAISAAFKVGYHMNEVINARLESNGLVDDVRTALSSYSSCTKNFQGVVLGADSVATPVSQAISVYDENGNLVNNVVGKGNATQTTHYRLGQITLTPGPTIKTGLPNNEAEKLSTLSIIDTRLNGLFQARTISMLVTFDAGSRKITGCIAGLDTQANIMTRQCLLMVPWRVWDPQTNQCVFPPNRQPYTFIVHNPYTGNCPANSTIESPTSCWTVSPTGWHNPFPKICDNLGCNHPSPSNCVLTVPGDQTKGCTCQYAQNVNPSSFAVALECVPNGTKPMGTEPH